MQKKDLMAVNVVDILRFPLIRNSKEVVLESYLAEVICRSKAIQEAERVVKLYSRDLGRGSPGREWSSTVLEHPTTLEKLAMEPVQKRMLKDDLDKFVNRKEWYKKVGKA